MLSNDKDKMQWKLVKKAKRIVEVWAKNEKTPIYKIEFVTGWGEFLGVYIFYNLNAELEQYEKTGVLEKTKRNFMSILNDVGYIKEFNDIVRISFDSDENVRKNYQGNYGLRLTDD